jgi:hypothetical protein
MLRAPTFAEVSFRIVFGVGGKEKSEMIIADFISANA